MNAGINIYWYKIQILFLGASVGSFAGAFGTHMDMFAGMPGFALDYAIMPVAAAVVGGMGTFAGPMIGAFILVPLSEILRALGALRIVFYGLFLVVFIVALPEGIFHYIQRKYHQLERWVELV
jgi:branched-chain amino acid transport system permease protein